MKPVEQTVFSPPLGNCFAACLASILECPLEDVPQPTLEEDIDLAYPWPYWNRVDAFLAERNLEMISFSIENKDREWRPKGYAILTVNPPGCDFNHDVVTFNSEVVWNPWPFAHNGLGEWKRWNVLIVRDPAKPIGVTR